MAELETVDVADVEILSAGGPVHGIGSPPEGDFWSKEDLAAIAAANRELAGEVQAPNKIGHSAAQALLLNSGIVAPTPGEMPAVGWLDGSTFRVEERDGVAKLLADVREVPKKFADLIETKAYRTRSVELSRVESQEQTDDNGKPKVYDWVVTGLAWLGAKLPAVRTLDDVVALYEGEDLDKPNAKVFVVYATGDVVWDPEDGFQDLRDDINEALNGPYTGGMNQPRFWVADVALTLDKALVQDYMDDDADGWVVPFTRAADDSITIAPSSDWIVVERGWVEAARELTERHLSSFRSRADIRPVSTKTYTDEQRRKFAEALAEHGVEVKPEGVTDEQLAKAGVETPQPPAPDGPQPTPTPTDPAAEKQLEQMRKFEERANAADERVRKLEEQLRNKDRDVFVEQVLRDGKATPGQRDSIVAMYEQSPEVARKFFESAPVNDEWSRAYGVDEEEITDEQAEADEKAYEAYAKSTFGVEQVL